jgi:hypothetical protein
VERTTGPVERHANASEAIGQHIVRKRHDLVSGGMKIAVHVADEMANPGCVGEIARMHDEDVFIRGSDDVGGFHVAVQELPGMKNRASW